MSGVGGALGAKVLGQTFRGTGRVGSLALGKLEVLGSLIPWQTDVLLHTVASSTYPANGAQLTATAGLEFSPAKVEKGPQKPEKHIVHMQSTSRHVK